MSRQDDRLVNESFLDGCNHPDYELEQTVSSGMRLHEARCVKCRARVSIGSERLKRDPLLPKLPILELRDPTDTLAATIPHHFVDMPAARAVLRGIETKGWEWKRLVRDGEYTYSAVKGTREVDGAPSRQEIEAIRNMAVKLARSPLFRWS